MWGENSARPGSASYSGYTLFAAETVMPPDSEFFKQEGYYDAGYKVTPFRSLIHHSIRFAV